MGWFSSSKKSEPVSPAKPFGPEEMAQCLSAFAELVNRTEYTLQRFHRTEAEHTSEAKLIANCVRQLSELLSAHQNASEALDEFRKNVPFVETVVEKDLRSRTRTVLDDVEWAARASRDGLRDCERPPPGSTDTQLYFLRERSCDRFLGIATDAERSLRDLAQELGDIEWPPS